MADGPVTRWVHKLLVGPIVNWIMARMLKWGWIYPNEVEDIRGRMKEFGRGMIDAQAKAEKKSDGDTPRWRDKFRGRSSLPSRSKSNATQNPSSKTAEGKSQPQPKQQRVRFRSRKSGAFRK